MATYSNLSELFQATAQSIRNKKGTTTLIKPVDFPAEIDSIKAGGGAVDIGSDTYMLDTNDSTTLFSADECGGFYIGIEAFTDGGKVDLVIGDFTQTVNPVGGAYLEIWVVKTNDHVSYAIKNDNYETPTWYDGIKQGAQRVYVNIYGSSAPCDVSIYYAIVQK